MTAQVDTRRMAETPESGSVRSTGSAVPPKSGMRPKSYRDSLAYQRSNRHVNGVPVWPLRFGKQHD